MIRAGRLREPAELLLPTQTGVGDAGGPKYTDVPIADIYISVSALSGRRAEIARQLSEVASHEVRARYDSRIKPGMGLRLRDGRLFNIESVRDETGIREELILYVSEAVSS